MIKKLLACVIGLALSTSAVADDHAVSMRNSDDWTTRKGLRFGYNYISGGERSDRIISPHMFAIGFESQQTMSGGDWLDLLFVQNLQFYNLQIHVTHKNHQPNSHRL